MDMSQFIMNQPIPGESMTSELGKYPHDNPPLISSASDSINYVMDTYRERGMDEEVFKMSLAGVPLEYIANVVVKMGFIEGLYTADVAEIIKPAVILHLLADVRDSGGEDTRIFSDAKETKMNDNDFMTIFNNRQGEI